MWFSRAFTLFLSDSLYACVSLTIIIFVSLSLSSSLPLSLSHCLSSSFTRIASLSFTPTHQSTCHVPRLRRMAPPGESGAPSPYSLESTVSPFKFSIPWRAAVIAVPLIMPSRRGRSVSTICFSLCWPYAVSAMLSYLSLHSCLFVCCGGRHLYCNHQRGGAHYSRNIALCTATARQHANCHRLLEQRKGS